MESSLTDFMMETILRFQNLIDVKVFFLVEKCGKEPKRRYCGTSKLIKQYESNGLSLQSADCWVELDATSQVLIDRPGNKRQLDLESKVSSDLSMWSMDEYNPDVVSPKKIKIDKGEDLSDLVTWNSCQPTITSEHSALEVAVEKEEMGYVGKTVDVIAEREPPSSLLLHSGISSDPMNFGLNNTVTSRQGQVQDFGQPGSKNGPASGFFSELSMPHIEERKLAAILAVDNPYAAYVKKTNEHKVWMSVLYKVGKNLAFTCPLSEKSLKNDATRAYFTEQCESFLRHIPALLINKEERPKVSVLENDCLRGCTVIGFIKQRILNGYCQTVRRTWPSALNDSRDVVL